MSATTVAVMRQTQQLQTEKLQKAARRIRSRLHPAVKISSNGDFRDPRVLSLPQIEVLMRRPDKCDLVSYTINVDSSWFRVFFTNSSNKTLMLCPVHIDAKGIKLEIPSLTVEAGQERDVALNLALFKGERDQRMEIYGDNKIMLLELRFTASTEPPPASNAGFSLAREEWSSTDESDSQYFSDENEPPVPTPPPLPVLPEPLSYRATLAARNAFKPELHQGETNKTDARLARMHALLR